MNKIFNTEIQSTQGNTEEINSVKLRALCTSVLIFIFTLFSLAQEKTIDSLKLALKNAKHDTTRCNILSQLAETASATEWPEFNNELHKLSKKYTISLSVESPLYKFYSKHFAYALANSGVLAAERGDYSTAIKITNDGLKIMGEINDRNGIAFMYSNSGGIYEVQHNKTKALEYKFKSLALYQKLNDSLQCAKTLNKIGLICAQFSDVRESLKFYLKSLNIYEKIQDSKGISACQTNIGSAYFQLGYLQYALKYYSKSLELAERIGDKQGIGVALSNISIMYENSDNVIKAKEYYLKSLKLFTEIGDKKGMAICLNNIGNIHIHRNENDTALKFYIKGLNINEGIKDKSGMANSYIGIGGVYGNKNLIEKSLEFQNKSLKLREEIGDKEGIANALQNMCSNYWKMANAITQKTSKQKYYRIILQYLLRAMKLSKEIEAPDNIAPIALWLHKIYKEIGDDKHALENYELHIQMRDSINNIAVKKASIKSQLKYEYEKKAATDSIKNLEEIRLQDAKLVAQEAKLKQEKTQFWFLVTGLGFLVSGFIFVINRFRLTQKQKKIIEEQKIIVDKAFEKLHEKNKEVMDSIKYAKRIQTALITSEKYIERKLNALNG